MAEQIQYNIIFREVKAFVHKEYYWDRLYCSIYRFHLRGSSPHICHSRWFWVYRLCVQRSIEIRIKTDQCRSLRCSRMYKLKMRQQSKMSHQKKCRVQTLCRRNRNRSWWQMIQSRSRLQNESKTQGIHDVPHKTDFCLLPIICLRDPEIPERKQGISKGVSDRKNITARDRAVRQIDRGVRVFTGIKLCVFVSTFVCLSILASPLHPFVLRYLFYRDIRGRRVKRWFW